MRSNEEEKRVVPPTGEVREAYTPTQPRLKLRMSSGRNFPFYSCSMPPPLPNAPLPSVPQSLNVNPLRPMLAYPPVQHQAFMGMGANPQVCRLNPFSSPAFCIPPPQPQAMFFVPPPGNPPLPVSGVDPAHLPFPYMNSQSFPITRQNPGSIPSPQRTPGISEGASNIFPVKDAGGTDQLISKAPLHIPEAFPPGQSNKNLPAATGIESGGGIPNSVKTEQVKEEDKVPCEEVKKPLNPDSNEESLEKLPISDSCTKRFQGNSYMYRNVYKSIMRNMNTYVRNNRAEIVKILTNVGYDRTAMEHAFLKLQDYNFREHRPGGNKMAQEVIKRILSKRNIYAFILRETTYAMIQNGKVGKIGRVTEKNAPHYMTAVNVIYEEAVKAVGGEEAKGKSFDL